LELCASRESMTNPKRSVSTPEESRLDKAGEWWTPSPEAIRQKALVAWMEHDHIKRHIQRRTTGDPSLDWLTYVLKKYFPVPVARALSLGCGEGGLERHALGAEAVGRFDAYDISPGAVDAARRAAASAGLSDRVHYAVKDLNDLRAPRKYYDAVFASMSIHHIEALEDVFREIQQALKPSGYFVMNEYIGPSRFQLRPGQLKLINDLLSMLPEDLRRIIRDGKATAEIKRTHEVHPLSWFDENDPSEAVRSEEILPILQEFFGMTECRAYGGELLQFLLENIVGNFDEGREDHRAWLDMLAYVEGALEEAGAIRSDFALIVAIPQRECGLRSLDCAGREGISRGR